MVEPCLYLHRRSLVHDMNERCTHCWRTLSSRRSLHGADGYRREDSPERSFMYSLRIYVVPLKEEDGNHKYVCLVDPTCRNNKTTVPCKKGDLSNVNTHHKSRKPCICALYVGYVQNHTRGIYQGTTLQRTSVSCVRHSYPYPELL